MTSTYLQTVSLARHWQVAAAAVYVVIVSNREHSPRFPACTSTQRLMLCVNAVFEQKAGVANH